MTVLVCGATGTTGGEVLRQLGAAGIPVRAMTRQAAVAAQWRAEGRPAVVADLADPDSLPPALDAVDAVYVATNASPRLAEYEGNLARAAAAAGVKLFVKLSVVGAAADGPIEFARMHHEAEEAILAASVPVTFLRPNGFMQNTLAWAAQLPGGVIRGPVMDARWSIVDARDIAAVAVRALTDPDAHGGETYTLTGPEASSPREQVAVIAEILGRGLDVEDLPIETALAAMRAGGWPSWSVDRMGELFGLYADGLAEEVSPDIERVTGRPATSYRQFALDHRLVFSGTGAH
jgi:uncharacterized protein YbjT (DUF2867 family)